MTAANTIHQRCWNHESREAVCRCPECRHSYCRECVTEHEARLVCAACLAKLARTAAEAGGRGGALSGAMLAGGIALAWLLYFGAAEALRAMAGRG